MENYHITENVEVKDCRKHRRRRVSWGSIFAGTVVVIAVSMLLSLLGSAIGMFMIDPTDAHPFSGVFGTVGIWTCVSILIGLACGGFVAGKLAGADGFIHGFVVWSATMIAGVMLVGSITAGIMHMAGRTLKAAGSVVAEAGSAVKSGVSTLADEAEDIFGDIDFKADGNEMRADVRQALRRSGVKEFQPEYLRGQYRAISQDLKKTVRRVMARPQQAGDIVSGFTTRLNDRVDNFAKDIDRQDVVRLVATNSNMSQAQAEETVDQYMELIDQAREQMNELQQTINQASRDWEVKKQELLVEADKATNSAGWAGVLWFIALLLGAVVSSFAGSMGTRKTKEGYEA